MSNYTPRPWEITWGPIIDVAGIAQIPVADDGRHTANARLIAAAPELLEALQGLDEAYCRADRTLTPQQRAEDRKRLIAARAAIEKALGT